MSGFPYAGYAGQYLRIDLSNRTISKHELPLEWAEKYLGGNGMGTKILWDEVPEQTNPLDPANKLIVATGPLCGSPMPNSGRLEFIAKSPLTGIYGDANAGGHFGPELKYAGYDLIIFEGRASQPVYLLIRDENVEIVPAGGLWGKGTFQTETFLQEKYHDSEMKVACIGPAGENLVRFACIQVTHRRSAARAGIGAVMGSKNLKAIAVRGTCGLKMADPGQISTIALQLHDQIRKNQFFPGIHRFGTPGLVALVQPMGRFPTRNFREGSFEGFDRVSGEALREEHFTRDIACFDCPLGCDKVYTVVEGEYSGTESTSVEYETMNSLGARVCNRNLPALIKANEICDDLGMDTISAGSAVAFAMELREKGILSESECEGLEMNWGNHHTLITMLEKLAYRRDKLSDLLAEGTARAAAWLGRGSERYAMHVKGQDIPAQDGRAQQSMGLAHATSTRGADHLKAFPTIDETGAPSEAVHRYGEKFLPELVDPLATRYKAMLVKDGEDFGAVVDSCGNCKSGGTFVMAEIYWKEQAAAIQASTGMEMSEDNLRAIGERIYNLQRAYNALHGITRVDDALPWRFTKIPSPSGHATGSVCHLKEMLDEYYPLRGWDEFSGLPKPETLDRLDLNDVHLRIKSAIDSGSANACRSQLGWAPPYDGPVKDVE